jgi:two-component system, OmpR family, sensor histidine kinase VicK
MPDFPAFFMEQAEASTHIQFVYDVAAARVVYINAAYEKVLHGKRALVNAELPELLAHLHPDDLSYLKHYWSIWKEGQITNEVEVRLLLPDQPPQWFCMTPSYFQTKTGVLLGGSVRNISVMKRYQENSDLFNSRKNATLEILSHDLSGAFILIQQIAEFLREEVVVPTDSRIPDMLNILELTSRDSVAMIRDLINLEFLSSTSTDLKGDRVDIGRILQAPLEQLRVGQQLLGYRFTYSLPAEAIYVNLDVNKFTQVLINLVGNALKFTPDEGNVAVRMEVAPGCIRIHVIDDGIGIPLSMQPFLFERFTKARRAGLRGEPTIGLGLALCKTIVEWHHGTLTVQSVEGQGTTFTVELPRSEAAHHHPAAVKAVASAH